MNNWIDLSGTSGMPKWQRTYDDATDVILEIVHEESSYRVVSSVESRTSGPAESVLYVGDFETAKKVLAESRERWDARADKPPFDWRKLTRE